MLRISSLLLTAALVGLVVTVAAQGPAPAAGGQGGRGQMAGAALPGGAGKEMVSAVCAACHNLNLVTNSAGYTKQQWHDLVATMVRLPDAQADTVAQYLATHFPPRPGLEPVLVPGPVKVTFKEWLVPTLGQRARDPVQTSDGMIWWVGQFGNVIGRLDPRTGDMKEFKTPAAARPHSITNDSAGNIWYMGNANATVGKLNPATGEITEYKMPDPAARDPHTPIFDRNGTLWFSLQRSNMVGRMNTTTGEIRLVTIPTPRALPYGVDVDSKGTIWVSYNGSYKVASIDPVTMAVKEWPMPDQRTTIRRLAIGPGDIVWWVNSSLGRLGRLNPATGEIKEWPSPSGTDTHPYAIAVVNGKVWYNESRRRPDTLVMFDPATEKFQSWAIPSGVGTGRHFRPTADGRNLLIHQTSTNRIGLVTIERGATATTTSSR